MGDSGNNEISVWVGVEMDEDSDEVREDEVAWLEMISEMEDGRSIPLAIVSQDILNYDGYVFERLQTGSNEIKEIIREMYRPYLVEYYIDPKELGEKQSDFLRQMCQEKTWYKAELVDANTDTKGGIAFQGVFVHTASPVEYEGKKLVIGGTIAEQKDLNKIKNTYNMAAVTCALDTDVQKELANLFKGVRFQTAKVYNVGNGNCIYFYGKKECREKRFFYDIGFDMHVHIGDDPRMMEQEYRVALQDIRESKPDCIILSHWDEDHFRGCAYAEKELFDTRWIAPGINSSEKKANAKRFLLYLYYIGSLMVVDRNAVSARAIAISHSNKSKMTLYVGKRQSGTDRKITKCNCEGVAICMEDGAFLRGSKIRCLMQGDVPYMSLPPAARTNKTNHYDYLVAPHHGAEMDCSSLSAHGKKDGQAVICCTGETGKNRPNEAHLEELQNCYAGVKTTAQANEYIQLDLRRKNRMRIDGKR
jgi:beta-lactamase superfamily II metal-dependent hydrolase